MEIRQCMLMGNTCYQRNMEKADSRYTCFQRRGPLGIMLHSTGANNPYLRRYLAPDDGIIGKNQHGNDWNRTGIAKCVHAMIGKDKDGIVRTYQCLPWNFRGWHCAKSGNNTHVSIEICEDALADGHYLAEVYAQAVELTAHICKEYGLDPMADGVVIDHAEGYDRGIASDHGDVGSWFKRHNITMDDFRRDTAEKMRGVTDMTAKELEQLIDSRIAVAMPVYRTLEDIPDWAKETVSALVERGIILGDGQGLNLSRDLVRTLVMLDRMGTQK